VRGLRQVIGSPSLGESGVVLLEQELGGLSPDRLELGESLIESARDGFNGWLEIALRRSVRVRSAGAAFSG